MARSRLGIGVLRAPLAGACIKTLTSSWPKLAWTIRQGDQESLCSSHRQTRHSWLLRGDAGTQGCLNSSSWPKRQALLATRLQTSAPLVFIRTPEDSSAQPPPSFFHLLSFFCFHRSVLTSCCFAFFCPTLSLSRTRLHLSFMSSPCLSCKLPACPFSQPEHSFLACCSSIPPWPWGSAPTLAVLRTAMVQVSDSVWG